ncbi:proline--tRNA ligase [Candidatus Phytoplasma pini]|uniref:Proline--tRNA ligase n=1 Tax=Candidatus Phytoplasma pini TaxID=267362 RepID=A0A559KJF1_9MOLU|nr:proline--tRNA ligase [Candidatus Phytoplasma pini]TVY12239.1 prolyl-tRNA synthetase [Candidatus Phytoplasma pini]
MIRKKLVKEITSRNKDFSKWYIDVCLKSELIDYSDIKGFFIYLPYGYALWEKIQKFIDKKLKKNKHHNVYFPLFFTEKLFQQEKEHISGFAPETIKITHVGNKKLENILVIRPTSEVLFSQYFAKKIFSYRDLPKLFNQWCSVVRWEKNTKPFLRSKEFLWQEGHTAHSSSEEALKENFYILDLYKKLGKELLAIPFVSGRKTNLEKFNGAEITYSIEALMNDNQALQAGTSHYLGQRFAKAFQIKFQNTDLKKEFVYQTSWGISSRLIGAVIMIHGDDEGLVMPPYLAPIQIVIIPLQPKNERVVAEAKYFYQKLRKKYSVYLDEQDKNVGWKFSFYELKGVPIRLEIGFKDIENEEITVFTRYNLQKKVYSKKILFQNIPLLLEEIHQKMFQKAFEHLQQNIFIAKSYEDFKFYLKQRQGYIKMSVHENEAEKIIKLETGATARVILDEELITTICPITRKKATQTILFAKAY